MGCHAIDDVIDPGLVLAWYKTMKYLRAYSRFGPFVTMLDHIAKDAAKFFVLYIVLLAPMAVTFLMFAQKGAAYRSFSQALFAAYRLTNGDTSWDEFNDGHGENSRNTSEEEYSMWLYIVYIYWTVISAIVMVNLLIAMMGQSFQDVYATTLSHASNRESARGHLWIASPSDLSVR